MPFILPAWAAKALPFVLAALALLAALATMQHRAEKKGEAKVTAKVEQQHAAAVVQARTDERAATAAAVATGSQAMAQTDAAIAALQFEEKRIHDALDAVPPATPGATLPAAPAGVLAASINDGVARANRAADAADAASGTGEAGAP